MATIGYIENDGQNMSTWTFTITGSNITASGSTFNLPFPNMSAKYVHSKKNEAACDLGVNLLNRTYTSNNPTGYSSMTNNYPAKGHTGTEGNNWVSWTSNTQKTLVRYTNGSSMEASKQYNTSSIFNASNKNIRSVPYYAQIYNSARPTSNQSSFVASDNFESGLYYGCSHETTSGYWNNTPVQIGTITLNAPPTFSNSNITITGKINDTIYAGKAKASVTVSSATAKYGGSINSIVFQIGNQSVSSTSDSTLSIDLNTVGKFIPKIIVTDSRGQTTTKELQTINVEGYQNPSITINSLIRVNSISGKKDDEGTAALIEGRIIYVDAISDLIQPIVQVTDENNNTYTANVTWYSDYDSNSGTGTVIDWSNTSFTSPVTLYGLITSYNTNTNFNTEKSFLITVTPRDNLDGTINNGTASSRTLEGAFYTIDFLGGGHGIAFGQPATEEGFVCNMSTTFNQSAIFKQGVNISSGQKYKINGTNLSASDVGALASSTVHVTETGSGSGWYWRKWSNGSVEAWGSYTFSSTAGTAWSSGMYYYNAIVSIPSGIFPAKPLRAFATSSGDLQWMVAGIYITSATSVTVRLVKPVSSSQPGGVYIYLWY